MPTTRAKRWSFTGLVAVSGLVPAVYFGVILWAATALIRSRTVEGRWNAAF